jgi:hypothetical protein
MRDPARLRNIALAIFAGAAATFAGSLAWAIADDNGVAGVLIALSIAPAVGGLIMAMIFGGQASRRRRLLAGRDVTARWRVGAERWAQFVALEARLAASGEPPNILRPRAEARDVEVIAGAKSVVVDGELHDFADGLPFVTGARVRFGPPLCVEIALYYPGEDSGDGEARVLRVPVGAGADGDAARMRTRFEALAAAQRGEA